MYNVISMVLGIGMLLAGIWIMRYGLKKVLWKRFYILLSQLTSTPLRGLAVGTIAAALMQSSTAVSLITIGLVNAECLTFYQGIGIILGANIGTCSTVQLMSVLLPKEYLIPILLFSIIVAGISVKKRNIAIVVAGICCMFIGLSLVSDALGQLSQLTTVFDYLIQSKHNSFLGIAGGIILTFLFQSSSAATGILMILAEDGVIDLSAAAYAVYGNNIGSCLSSLIVGAAANLSAKRVAVSHILLNLLGVLLFLPCTNQLIEVSGYFTNDFARQVATIHTLFNVLSSLLVMPFVRQFAQVLIWLVPNKSK